MIAAKGWAASRSIKPPWLREYIIIQLCSSIALFAVLANGFSVSSPIYGFFWTIFAVMTWIAATGYVMYALTGRGCFAIAGAIFPMVFFLAILPVEEYYRSLSLIDGIVRLVLGIVLLSAAMGAVDYLIAGFWLSQSVWQYGFSRFSHLGPTWWRLNEWLPAVLAITFYTSFAIMSRRQDVAV